MQFKQILIGTLGAFIIGGAVLFQIPSRETTLHILHTNDLHAHLIPWHPKNADCAPNEPTCRGGFARIKTLIDVFKNAHPDAIVLDAGDRFSGTVFYTFRKSTDIINTLKDMGYDAFCLGNHEFDDGLPELTRFVTSVSTPVVTANIDFPTNIPIRRHTVLNRNGKAVGIIGAVTESVKTETNGFADIPVHPVHETVCAEAAQLKQRGVHLIIALTHIGIEADKALAQACPDVDIIVGAHTHTLLSNDPTETTAAGAYPLFVTHPDGTQTAIVTAGLGGHHVGHLTAHFNTDGHLTAATGDTVPVTQDIAPNPDIDAQITGAQNALADLLNTPLALLKDALPLTPHQDFCSENCAVGNALADLALSADPQADFAMLNSGGIRAALPAGTVTVEHLAQAYPFDSKLVTIPLTGREIMNIIRSGIADYLNDDRTNKLAIVAGLTYTFNGHTRTVTKIQTTAGNPIQPDKTYAVVVPSFLSTGGDGFPRKQPIRILSDSVRDALIQQIKKHPPHPTKVRIIKK